MKNASTLERKVTFFFVAVGAIALTYGFLYLVDFLPDFCPNWQEQTPVSHGHEAIVF